MSMERWNPFRDFDNMRQAMDRWMDERFPGSFMNQQSNMLSVALDVHETENGYELEASLPGVKPEDIDINVERDTITLRGQSRSEERQEGKNYLYRERRSGTFYRSVRLPDAIDGEKVEANLENGILRVRLPRLAQTTQRRIQVRGQSGEQRGGQPVGTQSSGSGASQSQPGGGSASASSSTGGQRQDQSGSHSGQTSDDNGRAASSRD